MEKLWNNFPLFDQRLLDLMYSKNRFYHDSYHTMLVYQYSLDLYERVFGTGVSGYLNRFFQQTAAWHDVVYDMSRKDNEDQSAVLFEQSESAKNIYSQEAERIALAIRASSNHWDPAHEHLPPEILIFLDADLAELAAPWPVFDNNSQNILKEYKAAFPWSGQATEFHEARKKFFETVLAKDKIYWRSPHLEKPARANLEFALKVME